MGFIDFTNGEVLTADQMDLVMRQGVMRFADATARDTALSEVLAEGMMAYLDDTDEVLKYDGTDWIDISGDITGVTAGTALTGGGTSGNVTLDVDESALTIAQSQVTDLVSDLTDKQDDVITTQGDLVIGDASGDAVRLPVGTADQVLTSDGTTVSFQDAGGGGAGDWTLIVNEQSLSGVSVQLTGLSGYSDYAFLLINVSSSRQDELRLTDINGAGNGGIIRGAQSEFKVGSTIKSTNQPSVIQLMGTGNNGAQGDAIVFIQGAGSTTPAICEWQGGSNDEGGVEDFLYSGKTFLSKNSQALDTITFSMNFGVFDFGAISVYAR